MTAAVLPKQEEHKKNGAPPVRRVLVTGAAGCVGSFLVDELLAHGCEVLAVDRPGVGMAQEGKTGLTARGIDLRDAREAARAVRGTTAVIHAAAIVDISKSFEELRGINLDSVRTLYEAASREGATDFVFFSSASIYSKSSDGAPRREDDPLEAKSDYERTKLWAEEYLRSRPPGGPRVTILRPALVFGPRGVFIGALLGAISALLERWSGPLPAVRGGPRTNWVHAEDVARAAMYLLDHPQPSGSVFNVANDDALSMGETMAIAARTVGIEPSGPGLELPAALLKLGGALLQPALPRKALNAVLAGLWRRIARGHALRGPLQLRVDREMLQYVDGDVVFDNSRLKATGFCLAHPRFEPAWRETVAWYRQAGWMPKAPVRDAKNSRGAFRFSETMAGTARLDQAASNGAGGERRFRFTVTARAASQLGFWVQGERLSLEGTADLDGLATTQPARGSLDLSPLSRRELVYELAFRSDRGEPMRFYGRKRISHLHPLRSWTTLQGALLQSGMPVGEATLRFDLPQLPRFVASYRPW
jgi:nucleoside-diphosphate-sugar epimerase